MEKVEINGVVYVPLDKAAPAVGSQDSELEGLRYAIVRSRDQGVMCGYVKAIEGRRVTLLQARQMWRWSSRFVLPDIAEYGLTQKWERKFSAPMSQPTEMLEACGVMYCTKVAADSLRQEPAQDCSDD